MAAKRKISDDEDEQSQSEQEQVAKKPKKAAAPKKEKKEKPAAKKTKKDTKEDKEGGESPEHTLPLISKKRVSVRKFKGKTLVDIREYYVDDGEEKPGRKGIALSVEDWKELVKNVDQITEWADKA